MSLTARLIGGDMHSFGLNDVFEEGWAAFLSGRNCPYSYGSVEWNAWHDGYYTAEIHQ